MKKLLWLAPLGALMLLVGCVATGPYGPYGPYGAGYNGYQPQPTRQVTTAPPVTETRQVPGRVEFHTTIPIQPGTGALVPRTYSRKGPPQDGSLRCFQVSNLYMRMRVKSGYEEGYYTGPAWFRDAGMVGSCRRWVVAYVDRCANDAEGAEAREYPERTETVVREREREVVTEPYPVPQPYPYPVYQPSYMPYVGIDIGWDWGYGYGGSYYKSTTNYNYNYRSVNISRPAQRYHRPPCPSPRPKPAPRNCPPGKPGGR